MRALYVVGIFLAQLATTSTAETPNDTYGSAVLCAAAPVALSNSPYVGRYGGRADPKKYLIVTNRLNSVAFKSGKMVGRNEARVRADVTQKASDLDEALIHADDAADRDAFQSKLGTLLLMCGATRS